MKIKLFFLLTLCSAITFLAFDQTENEDEEGVRNAVLNYVEGLYQVDSNRIKQSVHTDLYKIGYYYRKDLEKYTGPHQMTYQELVNLAASWNKDGDNANDDSPKKIEILDLLDKTATAKLSAEWGIDYFQLAKENDRWMIMNVLWQSPPKM